MMGLPIRIELANLVAVQRLHDADPRQHCRPARLRDQEQRLHRRLPLRRLVLGLRKLRDVFAGILERDELAAAGKRIGSSNARFQPRSGMASTSLPPIVPRERFGADLGDPARVCDLDLG
jgi:hypothetical protein